MISISKGFLILNNWNPISPNPHSHFSVLPLVSLLGWLLGSLIGCLHSFFPSPCATLEFLNSNLFLPFLCLTPSHGSPTLQDTYLTAVSELLNNLSPSTVPWQFLPRSLYSVSTNVFVVPKTYHPGPHLHASVDSFSPA